VQTRKLGASFETFTGSVEHTGPEKFPRKATCVQAFFSENPRKQPDANEFFNISKNIIHIRLNVFEAKYFKKYNSYQIECF